MTPFRADYYGELFLPLQNAVDRAIMGAANASLGGVRVSMERFPSPPTLVGRVRARDIGRYLDLVLVLVFMMFAVEIFLDVVGERQRKLKAGLLSGSWILCVYVLHKVWWPSGLSRLL